MDTCRPSKSEKSHTRTVKQCGNGDYWPMPRKAPNARFQLPGEAGDSSQYQSLVRCIKAGRNHRFPLARSSSYLGKLARATRYAAIRLAGNGWMGKPGHGAAVCTPRSRPSESLRGTLMLSLSFPGSYDTNLPQKAKRPINDWPKCRTVGAPGAIRTPDPLVRSQILYPTELRAR